MACKRSSVRLRYSPPDNQGFTDLRKAFFHSDKTVIKHKVIKND